MGTGVVGSPAPGTAKIAAYAFPPAAVGAVGAYRLCSDSVAGRH